MLLWVSKFISSAVYPSLAQRGMRSYITWRHLLLLSYGVIPGELDPLMSHDTCHTQKLHTLHAVTGRFCVVVAAHAHLSKNEGTVGKQREYDSFKIREKTTDLAGLFHRATRNLGRIFDKEIIQHIHLPAFLSAHWTSNDSHCSKRAQSLLQVCVSLCPRPIICIP